MQAELRRYGELVDVGGYHHANYSPQPVGV